MASFLDLFINIGIDNKEAIQGMNDTEKKAYSMGQNIGTGIKNVVGGVAKGTAMLVGAAATGIAALAKQSVSAYGETQQLIGGVETLFGDAADVVAKNAENAFQSAGLSANDYMQTVTSFSASLLQSLGGDTQKAAEYADMAVTDMSDNANKMGTSMESIQNAYQGFAKQNFTMLDNLKLGYGGTKGEMERLLADAEALSGVHYDISSYADMIEAIHVVQDEMGITGTTAKEAADTIQGSANMMKGAWENLVAGFANPDADLGLLIGQMVDSATTFLQNMVPTIGTTLTAIGQAVGQLAPVITDTLPGLVESFLPTLLESATTLVQSLAESLPGIFKAVADVIPTLLPQLVEAGLTLLKSLAEALPTIMGALIEVLPDVIDQIVSALIELAPMLLEVGLQLILALANALIEALPELIPAITEIITQLVTMLTEPDTLVQLIDAALQIMLALAKGLMDALPQLLEALPTIIENLVIGLIESLPQIIEVGIQLIGALVQGIFNGWGSLMGAVGTLLGDLFNVLGEWIGGLITSIGEWMSNVINTVVEWVSQLPEKMAYWAGFAIGSFIKFFMDLPENIATWFTETIAKVVSFGESLKTKAAETGKNFFNGLMDNIKNLPDRLKKLGEDLLNGVKSLPDKFLKVGSDIVNGLWKGISDGWQWLKDKVANLANSLLQGAKDALGIASPSKEFAWVGRMVDEGFAGGVDKYAHLVEDAVGDMADSLLTVPSIDSTISAMSATPAGSGTGGTGNTFTINVYPKDNDTARDIVDEIQYRIAQNVNMEKAVWAL